jgi:ribosomal protein S12 methylthiotransferase accessory factor
VRHRREETAVTGAPTCTLLDLVSPRLGIVRRLDRMSKSRSEPELPIIYRSILANFDYRRSDPDERAGGGRGETVLQAQASAIGEALERYCSAQVDAGALCFGAASELAAPAIEPGSLVLYSTEQYARLPFRRPEADMPLTWIPGSSLSGEKRYLPASMVYLGYRGADGSELFTLSTSNGLAAGPDLDSAIRAGLLELLERDAFLVTWMNRLPAPEIELDSLTGAASQAIRHYARHGVDVRVFQLLNGFPVHACMAVGFDREGSMPAAVVGLACDFDPVVAVQRAVMELAQVRPGIVQRCRERPPAIERYDQVVSLEDHSLFIAMPKNLHEFDFLLNAAKRVSLGDLEKYATGSAREDVEACGRSLAAQGIELAYVDLTTADLAEFPVKVVRVLATTLQPMHFGFGYERLGGERLFTIARELGFATQRRTASELNPCPHPLG